MKMITFAKPLSKKEERETLLAITKGDKHAEEKMITHNLRLVAHIIKRFKTCSIEKEELFSIGTIGLMKAVKSFDVSKNIQFATYATRCMENEILMQIRKEKKNNFCVSLEEAFCADNEGNEICLLDVIGSEKEEVEQNIEQKDNYSQVMYFLQSLPKQEKEILSYRFGIGREKKKQTDIAKMFNISQSYVSRIEKSILAKIKKEFQKPHKKTC